MSASTFLNFAPPGSFVQAINCSLDEVTKGYANRLRKVITPWLVKRYVNKQEKCLFLTRMWCKWVLTQKLSEVGLLGAKITEITLLISQWNLT